MRRTGPLVPKLPSLKPTETAATFPTFGAAVPPAELATALKAIEAGLAQYGKNYDAYYKAEKQLKETLLGRLRAYRA